MNNTSQGKLLFTFHISYMCMSIQLYVRNEKKELTIINFSSYMSMAKINSSTSPNKQILLTLKTL